MNTLPKAVRILEEGVVIIDQTLLPERETWLSLTSVDAVIDAISRLAVRGAPAIGVAGAGAVWLAALETPDEGFEARFRRTCERIADARPTAINLRFAVERSRDIALLGAGPDDARRRAREAAESLLAQEDAASRAMGRHGASLIEDGERILTYCNTGWLATTGSGTALAAVYAAHADGKNIEVFACESRPLLQGARLTAWELGRAEIPVTLLCDNSVGLLMARGGVDRVLVGADRIARNGDTANKIGTYMVAVLAKRHGIPFHVVAPSTTFDRRMKDGSSIPIEERDASEVLYLKGVRVAAPGARAFAPAFDVTPAELVTSLVTERGIVKDVSERGISALIP